MINTLVRRVLPLTGIALLLAGLVRVQRKPGLGADAYLHLRVGSEFLDGWSIGQPGHFGAFDNQRWYPTQWLSQVAMAGIERAGGLAAVMWLTGAVIMVLSLVVYWSCRSVAAPLPASLAAIVAMLAAVPGLSGRPQVMSYLLISIVTTAWLATARDGRPRWWLVLVGWVWVPLHGMWIVGILIGAAATVGIALDGRFDRRRVLQMAAIPALSIVVSIFTPVGLHIFETVLVVGDRAQFLDEWAPPDFTQPSAAILAAMIAVVVVAALRGERLEWSTILLLGLAVAWGLYTLRTTIVAAVMIAPLLAVTLQRMVPKSPGIRRGEAGVLVALLLASWAVLMPVTHVRADARVAPSWVDDRLDALPSGTRVLNEFNDGAYFLWRHPQLDLVMHGYADAFTDEEMDRNVDIIGLANEWDVEVADLDVDYALVDPDSPLGYALTDSQGWEAVQEDAKFALLTPPTD